MTLLHGYFSGHLTAKFRKVKRKVTQGLQKTQTIINKTITIFMQ